MLDFSHNGTIGTVRGIWLSCLHLSAAVLREKYDEQLFSEALIRGIWRWMLVVN